MGFNSAFKGLIKVFGKTGFSLYDAKDDVRTELAIWASSLLEICSQSQNLTTQLVMPV